MHEPREPYRQVRESRNHRPILMGLSTPDLVWRTRPLGRWKKSSYGRVSAQALLVSRTGYRSRLICGTRVICGHALLGCSLLPRRSPLGARRGSAVPGPLCKDQRAASPSQGAARGRMRGRPGAPLVVCYAGELGPRDIGIRRQGAGHEEASLYRSGRPPRRLAIASPRRLAYGAGRQSAALPWRPKARTCRQAGSAARSTD